MLELQGKFNKTKVFTDNVENQAISQIIELLNQEVFKDSKIRIMPDTHSGKGCVIGFTANLGDKIIPNIVGVDIGCGMLAIKLGNIDIEFNKLDEFIRENIAYGFNVNSKIQLRLNKDFQDAILKISEKTKSNFNRNLLSIGSLGGGNHFIEINKDKENNKWLVIHTGSRNFGLQIAKYHQKKAEEYMKTKSKFWNNELNVRIGSLKQQGLEKNIESDSDIKRIRFSINKFKIPKHLSYLDGNLKDEYLEDMKVAQEYSSLNRSILARKILEFLGLEFNNLEKFETIHNYLNFDDKIVRKGAISAKKGERVIIPINMRDGSIIAIGKGNEDWNQSAPHGAGRLMSRSKAKEVVDMNEYRETMKDIWSTSVKESTIDEAPMVYKPIDEIIENTKDTIEIIDIIRPLYNFKA